MAKVDDNVFPKIIESMNTTDQAAPTDATWKLYAKANGIFARSSNSIVGPFVSSASVSGAFHGAKGTNTAGTTINSATPTKVPFATEEFDTDAYHDTVTNNSRITVPSGKDGYYLVTGQLTWSTVLTGNDVYVLLKKNNTTDLAFFGRQSQVTGNATGWNLSTTVNLAATDYVELVVNQSSGSGKNLETTAGYNWLCVSLLGT